MRLDLLEGHIIAGALLHPFPAATEMAGKGPAALGTLFELPVAAFGAAAPEGDAELTAEALQALELGPVEQQVAAAAAAVAAGADGSTASAESSGTVIAPRGPTCIACGIGVGGAPGFSSAEEQRSHFSLDWHRFNVKRRAARQPPVSEAAFTALVEDERAEVGSISGSESEESDGEEDVEGGIGGASSLGAAGPQFAFSAADGKRYACWRALVAPERDLQRGAAAAAGSQQQQSGAEQSLAALRALHQHGGRWAVVMLRGGHFAAAVFNVDPARVANPRKADKFEALAHKSAHRYVVRAGQGGRQSAKDAGGKYAKSAGSRLRRYNEAALQRDVAEALGGWRELLEACSLIFVHAPSANWQQLFGGEAPLLEKADPRIRRVPFTTRRPTFSETKRVMRILVTLYELPQEAQVASAPATAAAEAAAGEAASQHAAAAADSTADAEQQHKAAAAVAAAAAEEQAAAAAAAAEEEEARRKKAEKRARQKAKQKEARQAEAAASRAAAEEAARQAADDEIGLAAAAVSAMSGKLTAKPAPVSSGSKASGGLPVARLSAKPRANEGADVRRARMAAAAEARMKALEEAAKQQQLR